MFISSSSRTLLVLASISLVAVACGGDPPDAIGNETADVTAATGADKATSCTGTEPFWGIRIDSKKVTWTSAGGESRTIENTGPRSAIGTTAAFASFYQGRTSEDPNRFLNVIITDAGSGGWGGLDGPPLPWRS